MNRMQLVAALALICGNSVFADELGSGAAPSGDKTAQATPVIQPPYVIQRPYVIEPPDVIQIEMTKLALKPPYRVESFDKAQPLAGQYLVGPDGTINLRQYGVVNIAGKTASEARMAIQEHLRKYLDSPELSVKVAAYNSKVYYVITQGTEKLGNHVRRLPDTGIVTVLDAISQVNGLSQASSKKLWIARSDPHNFGCQQILPIDGDAIARGLEMTTNYQILPGDRLYVGAEEPWAASKQADRGYQTMGRDYNRTRNGY